mmetsp:Transcript_12423/g.29598  ORF Transcript_12423/g.29598 Transcript_12423/m.29598 type:complete len:241 (+) Transcript_12423:566-1288(+)
MGPEPRPGCLLRQPARRQTHKDSPTGCVHTAEFHLPPLGRRTENAHLRGALFGRRPPRGDRPLPIVLHSGVLPALAPGRLAPSRHVLQRRPALHLRPADLQHLLAARKSRKSGVVQLCGRVLVGSGGGTVQEGVPPVAPGAKIGGDVEDVEDHPEGEETLLDLVVAQAHWDVLQHHRGDLLGLTVLLLLLLGDLPGHPAHQLPHDRPLGLGSAPAGLRSAGEVQEGVLQESHGFEGELQL